MWMKSKYRDLVKMKKNLNWLIGVKLQNMGHTFKIYSCDKNLDVLIHLIKKKMLQTDVGIFYGNDVLDYFAKNKYSKNDGATSILKQLVLNNINMLILYLVM